MTEEQWLKCHDAEKLLEHLKDKVSDRKLRLFAAACCHRIKYLILDPRSRNAVKVAERLADGKYAEDNGVVDAARQDAENALLDYEFGKGCEDSRDAAVEVLLSVAYEAALHTSSVAISAVRWQEDFNTRTEEVMEARAKAEVIAQVAMFRDIFGNPFRPVTLDPTWVTSDVKILARGTYQDRAFERMPILADALQDAGCDNEVVLSHCRDTSLAHVRGCWVIDMLLGKE